MNFNKKGLESYITIILVVTLILTFLISTVFSPLFSNDHQNCQNINYQLISKNKMDSGAKFKIKNVGNSKIVFRFDTNDHLDNPLMPDETKEYKVNSREDKINIIPLYIDLNDNIYECKGKKTTVKTNTLI